VNEDRDEQQQLRSVALRNAESIFVARQRAEEELVRTKEALERKTQELADSLAMLRRSERELADFFENASVGLHWVGPDGVILRVNQAELDLLGYCREEYVGHHIAEFHVDQDAIADILRRLWAGETLRDYAAKMRCKDGSIKHVLIDSSVMWEDDRFVHTRCFTRDVTDRTRVEEAQARLAAIVESSDDAIIGKTLDSQILSWNAGAERLFGYTAGQVIGQPVTLLIPADRQDEERLILERLRRGERIEHYETVRVSKEGRQIDVSLTVSPVLGSSGHVIAASTIARDITLKKRAEHRLATQYGVTRALAESATLNEAAPNILQAVCEHLGWEVGALWCVDQPSKVLRCLEVWHRSSVQIPRFAATCRQCTFQPGVGLPGRVWRSAGAAWIPDVVKDDNFPRGPVAAAEGLHGAFGFPILLKEEVLGVLEFFSAQIRQPDDDLLRMMTAIGSQIGQFIERERAEEALRESEHRFRLMADTIPSVIWTAATDGRILYANERWFAYCGLTPEENDQWAERVLHPDDYQRCVETWTAALQLGAEYEIEVRNRRHDGVYRWFVTRAVPFRDSSGRIVQWFGTTTDIDDRKRAEQENASLLATLKEADLRKDEFLAMLAHELRNPLAPIRNAAHIFRANAPLAPELRWAAAVMDRQVRQMTRLVDDLLDVSRISRGKIELRKQLIDLAAVVDSAVEASRPLIEKWGHELAVSIPSEPILLEADMTRLAQVLSNLLNNAAKYTDQGGRIRLTAERQSRHVLIRVKDTGIGIPPDMLSSIFDTFTQVDRSLERSEGGLGIGLTLVQRLVEMHGGSVEARSDGPGTGSEFLVHLPIAENVDGQRTQGAPGGEQEAMAPAARRILIVDDNADAADSLGVLLRMMGNEVYTAHDGLEAVGAAAAFQPDVALLDIGLPKLNGYEVARRIREQNGGSDMVLIALTGWGQEEDRRRSRAAGFNHHMTKPVEFGALQRLLAESNPRQLDRRRT
jgi:PAS domain S-box-containing protein